MMRFKAIVEKTYTHTSWRTGIHLLFWGFVFASNYYLTTISLNSFKTTGANYLLSAKNTLVIALFYYPFVYYVCPRFFFKKKYWLGSLLTLHAIGQIPFAINQMRSNLQNGKSMDAAVKSTVESGKQFGGGLSGSSDNSNSYDNFMIMRGTLFAAQRFTVIKTTRTVYIEHGMKTTETDYNLKTKPTNSNLLANPIDKKTATQNGF